MAGNSDPLYDAHDDEGEDDEFQGRGCAQGHRPSLNLPTPQGGAICILCFSNLLSSPNLALSVHVSYAISQFSQAMRSSAFVQSLRHFSHSRLLVHPLVHALASFDDEPLAGQIIALVIDLCDSCSVGDGDGAQSLAGDFVARMMDWVCSGALGWSRGQIYVLHCLGALLDRQTGDNPSRYMKDRTAFISYLVKGLHLPSEEINGEVFFVLYKLSILENEEDSFSSFSPTLIHLALEALIKTPHDAVRANCLALLIVLARKGYFDPLFSNECHGNNSGVSEHVMQSREAVAIPPLFTLFADAIKGPLLSSDHQVQLYALNLICDVMPPDAKHIQFLIEANIPDYVFEVLRLSDNKDPLVVSSIRVLSLLSIDEHGFAQSLAIGFPTLVTVLRYIAEVQHHATVSHILELISRCIADCPGILTSLQVEELALILSGMFKKDACGQIRMQFETFTTACKTFVALLKWPSSGGAPKVAECILEVTRNAIMSSSCVPCCNSNEAFLYSLYLMQESFIYSHETESHIDSESTKLSASIIQICEMHIVPWLRRTICEAEEEEVIILAVFETLHSMLLQGSHEEASKFAETLLSSSLFCLAFAAMGLFPSERMRQRVYMMFGSIIDGVLGPESGKPIRDSILYLPADPLDLLFILGQKSSDVTCSWQIAIISVLYVSSLQNRRLADDIHVLDSLEQYILGNSANFLQAEPATMTQIVHLYALLRYRERENTHYKSEAENLMFHLMNETEWDLFTVKIQLEALEWLFQQEQMSKVLCNHLMKLCRTNSTSKLQSAGQENDKRLLIGKQSLAKMISSGDNYGALLLVSLLKQLHEDGQEEDKISVVNLIIEIINLYPTSSEQFCMHGIDETIHVPYSSTHSSATLFTSCSLAVFNILRSVQPAALFGHDAWLSVTLRLLEFLTPKLGAGLCDSTGHLTMGVLILILHHSTGGAVADASSAILLSASLHSAIVNVIKAACKEGSGLPDYDEEVGPGKTLTFVLILYYFSLRSARVLFQDALDWIEFICPSSNPQPPSPIKIDFLDLCRLMYFGPSLIKLASSQCLVELISVISDQYSRQSKDRKCSATHLRSFVAVLEGLIFYGEGRVAMNCGLCLSMIFGWEKLGLAEESLVVEDNWCRMIVEEFVLSLAAPSFASEIFTNVYRPANCVATALLKLTKVPMWIESMFDSSCISGIIGNIAVRNVNSEMVHLFRELAARGYMNNKHITELNRVFEVCRKHLYMELEAHNDEDYFENVVLIPDDMGKLWKFLFDLMSSVSVTAQADKKRLLEAIEMFSAEFSART